MMSILISHRLAIPDLLFKVRSYWYKIQIFARAVGCQNIQSEGFVDQTGRRAGSSPPEKGLGGKAPNCYKYALQ